MTAKLISNDEFFTFFSSSQKFFKFEKKSVKSTKCNYSIKKFHHNFMNDSKLQINVKFFFKITRIHINY